MLVLFYEDEILNHSYVPITSASLLKEASINEQGDSFL